MSEPAIFDLEGIVASYRRQSDRDWVRRRLTTLMLFMSKNEMITKPLVHLNGVAPELKLTRSDFSEEGIAFFYSTPAVARWIDNRKPNTVIDDVRPLERALKKLRDTQS